MCPTGHISLVAWVLNKNSEAVPYGATLGITLILCLISFMGCIYWGLLSSCDDKTDDVDQ